MAYASKYYDPVKAHEYYEKHKQLKGRKKKSSISDLSETGKIAAKEVKERLQEELKAALKKVKRGNTAERKRLRDLYAKKYEAELEQIKNDPSMLKAQKVKAAKVKSSKGASKGKGGKTSQATSKATEAKAKETKIKTKTKVQRMADAIMDLKDKFPSMTDKQRVEARKILLKMVAEYRKMIEG